MAQWLEVQQLESAYLEQVHQLYSEDHLPMEVRQYVASWLEDQNWSVAAEPHSTQAHMLFHTLLALLDDQYGRFGPGEEDFVLKHNLRKAKLNLQAKYQECPEQLANIIANLLREERAILNRGLAAQQGTAQTSSSAPVETGQQQKIERRLAETRAAVQELDRTVRHLEELQDTFDFRYKMHRMAAGSPAKGAPATPEAARQMEQLQVMLNNVDRKRKEVLDRAQEVLGRCEPLRDFLLEELAEWKERQRRTCLGAACDTSLSCLETWFTGAAELLFQLWRLLRALGDQHAKLTYQHDPLAPQLPQLESRLQEQISCLVRSAFVVESQPIMPFPNRRPLVLKTNSKFSVRARLLVKLQDRSHQLEVDIGIDKDPPRLKGFRKFNILTFTSKMLLQDNTQLEGLVCDFRHITLKEQKAGGLGKGGKGASESLLSPTEELHLITFTLKYKYHELALELQTCTLPVVIISNSSQFASAWASVLWFNMLSPDPQNQLFFSAPPAAPWAQLAQVLSWQFSAATERGLDSEQLNMLAEKLFGPEVSPTSALTWARFSKDTPTQFSFWTWLDGILSLIRDHLAQLWKDGHIMGFVSHKRERQLLKRKQTGTFLLRFSESTRDGGITYSWVEPGEKGKPKIRSVEPYTKEELASLQLPDIICNYQLVAEENVSESPLKFLYPDTPRDEAFGKYYTKREGDQPEKRKYLNQRLIRVSCRKPSETCILEGVGLTAPDVEGLEAKQPEMPGQGSHDLEVQGPVLEPNIAELGLLEPGDPDLGLLEPNIPDLGLLEPGDPDLGLLEPGDPDLGLLEPGDPDLGPGTADLGLLELGFPDLEVLKALNMMGFDQADSSVLQGRDPCLPLPPDVPLPGPAGSPLFRGAEDIPLLQMSSGLFQ
ncbi:signal transducer and activator of transcription 2 [Carettochelys insculpta]|uniref:signal transducer and activator of transcription 2 n=1 Tax=Carettochelys insculpta TaxID=44489 RepID=UPI003EB6A753